MDFHYLSDDELKAVRNAILQTVGYQTSVRGALLGGIDRLYAGGLPGGANMPETISLTVDLRALSGQPRLTDGSVPLKTFLQNALDIAGAAGSMDPVREALAAIERQATGAPRVDTADLPETKEKIVLRDEMVPWSFMSAGLAAAQAVVKLEVSRFDKGQKTLESGEPVRYFGTGWLIAPGLILTNHHVLNARNEGEPPAQDSDLSLQTRSTMATFDFDSESAAGNPRQLGELVAMHPELDYALARIEDLGRTPLRISTQELPPTRSPKPMALNIIQHPEGRPKRFAIRNNLLTSVTASDVRYFTDTLGGSSGSPVCNDQWHAVALHRGAAPVSGVSYQGRSVAFVNVGTKIHAILADLRTRYPQLIPTLGVLDLSS